MHSVGALRLVDDEEERLSPDGAEEELPAQVVGRGFSTFDFHVDRRGVIRDWDNERLGFIYRGKVFVDDDIINFAEIEARVERALQTLPRALKKHFGVEE